MAQGERPHANQLQDVAKESQEKCPNCGGTAFCASWCEYNDDFYNYEMEK